MSKFIFAASLLSASSFSALGLDNFTSIIGAGYGELALIAWQELRHFLHISNNSLLVKIN
jgi:hypothetical protein